MVSTILVIGGAGYIGSHICKELYGAGFLPICYDNLLSGHRNAVKWGPFEFGDISSKKRLCEVIRQYSPTGVIHLATHAYSKELTAHPSKYYENNFQGSMSLFEAMDICGLKKIIYTSTSAVYGMPKIIPIEESTPLSPINHYGISVAMVERILMDFHELYGFDYITFRPFNVAGVDPEGEIGEGHIPEVHLIPQMLQMLTNPKEEFIVYGDTCLTPDGTCIRDYVHVTDVAKAYVKAMQFLEKNEGIGLTLNLGTGVGHSILEVFKKACEITGKKIPYSIRLSHIEGPLSVIAGTKCAQKTLGWKAEYTLEDIIQHSWDFFQNLI